MIAISKKRWNFSKETIITMKRAGRSWRDIAIAHGYSGDRESSEAVRNYARCKPWYHEVRDHSELEESIVQTRRNDGSISSQIKTRLEEKIALSDEELLKIHGLDPETFKVKTITSNEWSMTNGEGDKYYNFQSKIIAEPLKQDDKLLDNLIEAIQKNTIKYECKDVDIDNKYASTSLIIPLPDMHFGLNTAKEYGDYQSQIFSLFGKQYKTIIFSILGDWLHTDSFIHETASGTRVNDTNVPLAWEEASKFIEPLLQKALMISKDVRLIYSRGNHDESMTWAFAKYLETKYSQIAIDVSLDQLKVASVDDIAVYFSHGHKAKNKLHSLCASLYPTEWGKAKTRLLFTGHYHHQQSKDHSGIVHYQLPTISKDTDWEEENLFLGSDKGVHVFELLSDRVKAVYYL